MSRRFLYTTQVSLPVLRREVSGLLTRRPEPLVSADLFRVMSEPNPSGVRFINGRELDVHLPDGRVVTLEGGNVVRDPSVLLDSEHGSYVPTEIFFDPLPV